jgi:hypothetical protein
MQHWFSSATVTISNVDRLDTATSTFCVLLMHKNPGVIGTHVALTNEPDAKFHFAFTLATFAS